MDENVIPKSLCGGYVVERAMKVCYDVHRVRRRAPALKFVPKDEKLYDPGNEGGCVIKTAMAHLFEGEKDPIELIQRKEIFERREKTINVCGDVSNSIEGIVLKNA